MRLKIFVVCLVAVGIGGSFLLSRNSTDSSAGSDISVSEFPNADDDSSAAVDSDASAENSASPESIVDANSVERRASEVFIALGGRPEDNDCEFESRYVKDGRTGEMIEVLECVRSTPKPQHPYERYTNDSLETLAYSDPFAGMVLGRRVVEKEPEMAWELMIRSSALLHGDPAPIKWLANNAFSQVARNGVLNRETLAKRYVLDEVSRRLDARQPRGWTDPGTNEFFDEDEIDQLNQMVDSVLNSMVQIQKDVMGESTIRRVES